MNDIQFSQGAVDLIDSEEGFVDHPYVDPVTHGEPITIAYGSTHYCDGTKVTMDDDNVTKEQGSEMLLCYLNNIILPDLQKHIKVDLNQNEIDALGSLIYNIGDYGFDNSHVLIDINQGILDGDLETRWKAWNKAAGKINPDLVRRRQHEYNYFETGSIEG